MGQRANYIIRSNNSLEIYYNKWRAYHIAEDLYLGEERFLSFVRQCDKDGSIMNRVWMEGCVLADIDSRQLYFWCWAGVFTDDTSVIEYYLMQLAKKWPGWHIHHAEKRMYDLEKILGIDYFADAEREYFNTVTTAMIVNDNVGEWTEALVIIKQQESHFVTKTGDLRIEQIIIYGPESIALLLQKSQVLLPAEAKVGVCIIVDTVLKQIVITEYVFDLWEQYAEKWPGYTFSMGDYGYLKALRIAGLDVRGLQMSMEDVKKVFEHIIQQTGEHPADVGQHLFKNASPMKMPDYYPFSVVITKLTPLERFKLLLSKIFR